MWHRPLGTETPGSAPTCVHPHACADGLLSTPQPCSLFVRSTAHISALAGFCQLWRPKKFYLKGRFLLNVQDTKLGLTNSLCSLCKRISNSTVIKICSTFKPPESFTRMGVSCIWFNETFSQYFSTVISMQIFGGLEWGRRGSRREKPEERAFIIHESPCSLFYQTLSQNLLCNSFMCYR